MKGLLSVRVVQTVLWTFWINVETLADYLKKWWELINWDFVSQNHVAFTEARHGFIDPCNDNSELCDYVDSIEKTEHCNT